MKNFNVGQVPEIRDVHEKWFGGWGTEKVENLKKLEMGVVQRHVVRVVGLMGGKIAFWIANGMEKNLCVLVGWEG